MMTIIPYSNESLLSALNDDPPHWLNYDKINPKCSSDSLGGLEDLSSSYQHLSDKFINRKNNFWSSKVLDIDIQELKLNYIKSNIFKILPSLAIKTIENSSSCQVEFVKSINLNYLNLINSYYFLSLCTDEKINHTSHDSACIREVYNQLNFNFNDYKIKSFTKDKEQQNYSLIICSAFDNVNKILSFTGDYKLNFDELIIDKATLINNKTNHQEIKLIITIPKELDPTTLPDASYISVSSKSSTPSGKQERKGRESGKRGRQERQCRQERQGRHNALSSPIKKQSGIRNHAYQKNFEKVLDVKGLEFLNQFLQDDEFPVKQEEPDDLDSSFFAPFGE